MLTIQKAEFIKSGTQLEHYPEELQGDFLFLGRSNVGKSSLINAIVNRKNLARTSGEPGKTITLNFFKLNDLFYLVDAPGYGYARRSQSLIKDFEKMILEFIEKRQSLKRIFLLIDFKIAGTEDDVMMYQYLKSLRAEVTLIFTKYDKCNQSERAQNLKTLKTKFGSEISNYILTSSEKRIGIDKIMSCMEADLDETN